MEKRVYDLDENGPFSKIMPPLTTIEDMLLRESLKKEGCNEPLDVWNGVIVDGHNRCRICKELNIPFAIHEMTFESEAEATVWLIKKQLGRRNISTFSKITSVLRFEPMIREEAKIRMYAGKKLGAEPTETFPGGGETRNILGAMIDVSGRTIDKVRFLIENANEEIISRLESDDISIHTAYKMTKWHIETADEFTKYRIQKGVITLEQAYDEYKEREKEELERLKAQTEKDSHKDQDDEEWDEEGDYDPTFGGKVVSLFGRQRTTTPYTSSMAPLVAGGYIGGFTHNNRAQMNACPPQKKGEIVSIIPYLKARGWNPEDNNACDDDSGDECDDPNAPKAEIISIIPFLKARGRLPMDYEEPDGDADDDYDGEEEYDGNDQYDGNGPYDGNDQYDGNGPYDGNDEIEGEDDTYETVVHTQRVVNIADIKVYDPTMPISKGGVSLMGAYVGEDHGNGCRHDGSYEDDAMQLIRAEGGNTSTITFEMILTTMERVSHDFEDNMAILLSAVASEDTL